jgi:hypothetical protein
MTAKYRLVIEATDVAGLHKGFYEWTRQHRKLREAARPRRREGISLTLGDRDAVRDLLVYGTAERPKVLVGPPYETPEWMRE